MIDDDNGGDDNVVDLESARREQGAERAAEVLDQAEDKKGGKGGGGSGNGPKPPSGAHAVVAEMREAFRLLTDDSNAVYMYTGGAWAPLSEPRLNAMAYAMRPRMAAGTRRDTLSHLRAATYVPDLKWGRVDNGEIPCANGVLDVVTGKLRAHRPEDLLERVLPIKWDAKAKCERWLKALAVYFPEAVDGGRVGALQEFFGYICLPHARFKRALFLYGKPDTGKSLVAMVAKKLVGERFACTLGVEHMDDPQRLSVIKGKALNVITEVSADALIADGGFKTLVSTEEPIFIDAKYLKPENYTPSAKHLIVGNTLPRLNDQTSATFDRLLIIPFDRILTKADQDRGLLEDLVANELPGILAWAAEGARRLVERGGQWPDVEAARTVLDEYRADLNPIVQFMAETMRRDEVAITPLSRVATAFNKWNTGNRHFSVKYCGRFLRAAGYDDQMRYVKIDGRSVISLCGWRLVGEAPANLYVRRRPKDPDDMIEASDKAPVESASSAPATSTAAEMNDAVADARGEDLEESVP
jgi:putative DNA primase/helicase